jgi:peroxiredoxin
MVMRLERHALLALALTLAGCAHGARIGSTLEARRLPGTDGTAHVLAPAGDARLTVLVFFADHCPCQAAHDARLRDLYAAYRPRGVEFFAVDSEVGATAERDAAEAAHRAYPFPILIDHGGGLAKTLGADYATESYVLDRAGMVRYHGGLDSDKRNLHDDATPYLKEALDDLLDGKPPRRAESKALGCALQTW